jgi:hypothetical protein
MMNDARGMMNSNRAAASTQAFHNSSGDAFVNSRRRVNSVVVQLITSNGRSPSEMRIEMKPKYTWFIALIRSSAA